MKLIIILATVAVASSSAITNKASQLARDHQFGLSWHTGSFSTEDLSGCVAQAKKFFPKPLTKDRAIQAAMDHCALDKKVDDNNFVCPHYREILSNAFRRESTTRPFTATTFCNVAELYVSQLKGAGRIPNMGQGAGFSFDSTDCQPTVLASFQKGQKTVPIKSAPDFWYALCVNQDCAHYLPSRTRWCNHDHKPKHSALVCEAIRHYAQDEVSAMQGHLLRRKQEMDAEQLCSIFDEFVEDTHITVEAYMHVVHGTKNHPVPAPEDPKRALDSAKMKNQAGKHKLRDSASAPVKSGSETQKSLLLVFVSLAFFWH